MEHREPTPEEQIGTVSQKWCEKEQKVIGEFWFHEEKIPEALRKKLDNGEHIPISADYDAYVDEEGNQSGFSYTHVAVLDGENPVCPIEKCGVFERLPFSEQLDDLAPPEPKQDEKAPEVAPVEAEAVVPDVEPVEAETEEPKPDTPATENLEEASEPVQEEEEVRLEPEVIIPASAPVVQKAFEMIDGNYVFVPEVFKQQEKNK